MIGPSITFDDKNIKKKKKKKYIEIKNHLM